MSQDLNTAPRRPLIGGNWKMHKLQREATIYCHQFLGALGDLGADVALFPSTILLPALAEALHGSKVSWGGQDIHPADQGAHTGDTSGAQLADLGCSWVLCGHSERRHDHGESSELVGEKAAAAVRHGVTPLICVGETKEERQAGRTLEVLEAQLETALTHRPEPFALAYEPVWAIGTGETATPEMAQEAHAFLREATADLIGDEAAAARRILYGGSVNPDNAAELFAQNDIDGFLVGGASLDPERFLAIIRCCGAAA
jgi:triosephosphate isomerase